MASARRLVHELLIETVDVESLTEDEDEFDKLAIPDFPIWPDGAIRPSGIPFPY
jgi:hypothetical protein